MNPGKTYQKIRQKLVGANVTFDHVELLSYHLPKTAGTSLFLALEEAYGQANVRRVYDHEEIANLLDGKPLWVNKHIQVLHGHFRPNPNQAKFYPKAKRIIWVRDPIDWYLSTINHYLWQKNGKVYTQIHSKYLVKKDWEPAELALTLLQDPDFDKVRLYFSKFIKLVNGDFFHFVGKSEDYKNELKRLGKLLNKELSVFEANKNPKKQKAEIDRALFYPHLESQFEFIAHELGVDYRV